MWWLDLALNGVVYGSIIVLGSIGLSLIYSIGGFANFAHGDTMTVGAYAALVAMGAIAGLGIGFLEGTILGIPYFFIPGLIIGMATAAFVAVITEELVYKPTDVGPIGFLIMSIGLAFAYRGIIQLGFGPSTRHYDVESLRPIGALLEYEIRMTYHDIAIVTSALVLVLGVHVLLQYTDFGRMMRAMADNPDLAKASGIHTRRVLLWTWVMGAGLAGAAGVFLGLFNQVAPRMGFNVLLVIFAAVILGGIGSVYGAMLGGLLIGLVVQLTPVWGRLGIPIGFEYAEAMAFLVMVLVLLVRPTGIMGEVVKGGER